MTLEEFKDRMKPFLEKTIDEDSQELEGFFGDVLKDYESFENPNHETENNEWKEKYESLKQRYTDRFLNGAQKTEQNNDPDLEEEEKEETIEIEDLFTEVS